MLRQSLVSNMTNRPLRLFKILSLKLHSGGLKRVEMANIGQRQITRETEKSPNVFEDDYPTITVTAIVAETYERN